MILVDFHMFWREILLLFTKNKKIYPVCIDLSGVLGYNIWCTIFCMSEGVSGLDIRPGDVLTMKKNHPCGANEMFVIRSGMDFRLRCVKCSREFMVPRNKIEKSIKKVTRQNEE